MQTTESYAESLLPPGVQMSNTMSSPEATPSRHISGIQLEPIMPHGHMLCWLPARMRGFHEAYTVYVLLITAT